MHPNPTSIVVYITTWGKLPTSLNKYFRIGAHEFQNKKTITMNLKIKCCILFPCQYKIPVNASIRLFLF